MKAYRVKTKGYPDFVVCAKTSAKAKFYCANALNEARAQQNEMGKIFTWIRVLRAPKFDDWAKQQNEAQIYESEHESRCPDCNLGPDDCLCEGCFDV